MISLKINQKMDAKESSAYQQFKFRLKNIEGYGEDLLKKTSSEKTSKSKNFWRAPSEPGMHLFK